MQKSSSSLYSNFILNICKGYELNNWPRNPNNNVPLRHCLFCIVKLVSNAIKWKLIDKGQGIAFDGEVSWISVTDFARTVVIFCFDNISSFHTDNRKKYFLESGERSTDGINDSTGEA